ncbi:FmtA-like protein [Actinorhabdospora filicis]|uniref:FmtA-like protein n=1 Tax=Actinorhabdospora filicis TaxID=1785913 RepID=A0A9W6SHZ5_9ACTN|nr:serine hydrolase domain-containing protein [Actinorhabdospora filicis]GLZ76172.1 FmtA-like protein [Actinorhabdospora filicis]
MSIRRRLLLPLAAGIALSAIPVAPAAAAPPELTPESAKAFFDDTLPGLLTQADIPGASVTVVAGGRETYSGGYGTADLASGRPVEPGTAFFNASTAKLWTATAVMSLVDRGRLDLAADVNEYLDFEVPDTYPGRPVTLRNLLTHTAGFDGLVLGTGARTAADVLPLRDYVREHMPARVRPPGEVAVYDNYALALAGYVVEAVSGVPYADYLRDEVFAPLGMTSSTAVQPAPEPIAALLATGYGSGREPIGGQYGHDVPAGGGTVTTAPDMGRFMLAHLGDGGGVLSPASVALMRQRQWANHPGLPGLGLVWMEQSIGAERLLEHGGDVPGFHAGLALLPERNTGVYVTYNGDGNGHNLRAELIDAFVSRFFPSTGNPPPAAPGDTDGLAGTYQSARTPSTDPTRVANLFSSLTVTADGGRLDVGGVEYTPLAGDLWSGADGTVIGFRREADGEARYLFFDGFPAEAYERAAWYREPLPHAVIIALTLLALPVTAVWWLIALLRRRRATPAPTAAKLARATGWAFVASLAGVVAVIAVAASDVDRLGVGLLVGGSPLLNAIPALLTLAAVVSAAAVGFTAAAWRAGWWGTATRVHYTALTVLMVAFSAVAGYYQLLGWPFTARL